MNQGKEKGLAKELAAEMSESYFTVKNAIKGFLLCPGTILVLSSYHPWSYSLPWKTNRPFQ